MALKGTLKDFGIADILQLIGQQQKTGYLRLKSKGDEVVVTFREGNIVRARSEHRAKKELIGAMLVAAGMITEAQLEFGLETQKRSLQRLGDVLVGQGVVTAEKFKAMVELQTSETLFRLFQWKAGSYEFEAAEVEDDPSVTPLRAESVLMEGFRRVDEWPVVRKVITSLQMTFVKLKELPPPSLAKDAVDSALDDALAEVKKEGPKGDFQALGEHERRAFAAVAPGRTAARIIELAALGEFDTAKALCNLVNLGYLAGAAPTTKGGPDFEDSRPSAALGVLGRVAVTVVMLGGLLFVGTRIDFGALRLGGGNAATYIDPAAQRVASRAQMSRIAAALDIYQLEQGGLPERLADLVDVGLLRPDDTRYPWREAYYYRRALDGSYVLLPPLR